jgi:hypothetical protein
MGKMQEPLLLAAMAAIMALAAAALSTPYPAVCRGLVALGRFVLLLPEPLGSFQVQMFRALALEVLYFLAAKARSLGLSQAA